MDEKPERTLRLPKGTTVRIAKVHPAWSSVLIATNESLEVRELRRPDAETPPLASCSPKHDEGLRDDVPLALKWRRQNIQVTAAAFISHGNMLVVSDRGDRLLVLNYHGLQAAKRIVLPWAHPFVAAPHASRQMDHDAGGGTTLVEVAGSYASGGGGAEGGVCSSSGDSSGGGSCGGGSGAAASAVGRGGRSVPRGVCIVTAIVECPDVAKTEEWRSGTSHLAVSSSTGDVVLLKI